MNIKLLKQLMRLQMENERLRRAVSDLTLDELIPTEAARGNVRSAPDCHITLLLRQRRRFSPYHGPTKTHLTLSATI